MGKYYSSPEYSSLTPIPLLDPPGPGTPLASIAYPPAYVEAMSYLRAVMALNELSERAFALTTDVIGINPAHYTVWLYRAKILFEIRGSERELYEELRWLERVAQRSLKNYQIWHHRQTVMTKLFPHPNASTTSAPSMATAYTLAPPPTELPFLTRILALDAKNYHVWTYRQWLCSYFHTTLLPAFGGSNTEIAATEQFIAEDVRNNSAWNHRFFIVFGGENVVRSQQQLAEAKFNPHRGAEEGVSGKAKHSDSERDAVVVDEDTIDRELAYTTSQIRLAPQNQSPWLYLRGVLRRASRPVASCEDFAKQFLGTRTSNAAGGPAEASSGTSHLGAGHVAPIASGGEVALSSGVSPATSHLSAPAKASLEPQTPVSVHDVDPSADGCRSSHAVEWLAECAMERGDIGMARECWAALGTRWDPIRKGYWEYRSRTVGTERQGTGEGEADAES